jgi:hypothetical protein
MAEIISVLKNFERSKKFAFSKIVFAGGVYFSFSRTNNLFCY